MVNTLISTLISIGTGVLLAVPALFLGYWLKKTGKTPNHSLISLLSCIIFSVIRQIWFPDLSFGWHALFTITGSTVGVYRIYVYRAMMKASADNYSHL